MQPRAQALVDPGVNSPGRTAGASRVALATSKWCLDVQCGRSVRPEPPRSRTPLWIAIAALTLGLGGVGWYAKSHMSGQDGLIGELKGWPAAVAAVRQQLTSTERLLAEVPKEIDALTGRVSDLDNN
jgi:hypothetical protein